MPNKALAAHPATPDVKAAKAMPAAGLENHTSDTVWQCCLFHMTALSRLQLCDTGGLITANQLHSFAVSCAKAGVVQAAVSILHDSSSMQLQQSVVEFLGNLSGKAGIARDICDAGMPQKSVHLRTAAAAFSAESG